MRRLLRSVGDPQLRLPVVHVAGTKGKGSVSAMLAAMLQQAGYTVGSYTRWALFYNSCAQSLYSYG